MIYDDTPPRRGPAPIAFFYLDGRVRSEPDPGRAFVQLIEPADLDVRSWVESLSDLPDVSVRVTHARFERRAAWFQPIGRCECYVEAGHDPGHLDRIGTGAEAALALGHLAAGLRSAEGFALAVRRLVAHDLGFDPVREWPGCERLIADYARLGWSTDRARRDLVRRMRPMLVPPGVDPWGKP